MIQADHPLTVTRRCELLDVARSTVYYHPTGIPSKDLALMRLLDEIHLERPFYGSRRLRDELETQGHPVNRKRVQRLMRQMGLSALYPKPRTSQPGAGHKVYPYLLKGLSIERPNQGVGERYLLHPNGAGVHVSGGHPGLVLAPGPGLACCQTPSTATSVSRPSRTRSPHYGPPAIFNTDQGAQFHVPGVYDGAQSPCGGHQHGRQGTLGSTTCSSSVFGAASNTRMCIFMHTRHPPRSGQG